jgi:hypothetical protein
MDNFRTAKLYTDDIASVPCRQNAFAIVLLIANVRDLLNVAIVRAGNAG